VDDEEHSLVGRAADEDEPACHVAIGRVESFGVVEHGRGFLERD
jgi:hypothetical protein